MRDSGNHLDRLDANPLTRSVDGTRSEASSLANPAVSTLQASQGCLESSQICKYLFK